RSNARSSYTPRAISTAGQSQARAAGSTAAGRKGLPKRSRRIWHWALRSSFVAFSQARLSTGPANSATCHTTPLWVPREWVVWDSGHEAHRADVRRLYRVLPRSATDRRHRRNASRSALHDQFASVLVLISPSA